MKTTTDFANFGRRTRVAVAPVAPYEPSATEPPVSEEPIPTSWLKRLTIGSGGFVVCIFLGGFLALALEEPHEKQARLAKAAEYAVYKRAAYARADEVRQQAKLTEASAQVERAVAQRSAKCSKATTTAYVMTQDAVRSRLRSPYSAVFPYSTRTSALHVGNCKFEINAYFDAQNGFGAMLRSRYYATIVHYPAEGTWQVKSVRIMK